LRGPLSPRRAPPRPWDPRLSCVGELPNGRAHPPGQGRMQAGVACLEPLEPAALRSCAPSRRWGSPSRAGLFVAVGLLLGHPGRFGRASRGPCGHPSVAPAPGGFSFPAPPPPPLCPIGRTHLPRRSPAPGQVWQGLSPLLAGLAVLFFLICLPWWAARGMNRVCLSSPTWGCFPPPPPGGCGFAAALFGGGAALQRGSSSPAFAPDRLVMAPPPGSSLGPAVFSGVAASPPSTARFSLGPPGFLAVSNVPWTGCTLAIPMPPLGVRCFWSNGSASHLFALLARHPSGRRDQGGWGSGLCEVR
jgi:hypothetical protein